MEAKKVIFHGRVSFKVATSSLVIWRRHDIRYNDIVYNDFQSINRNEAFSIACWVSIMLNA